MKNFKKIVSLVLAVCLMASLAIGASAANTVDASGDTGTSSVTLSSTADGSIGGDPAATKMSVTVPTVLPIAVGTDGTVNTASDAKIIEIRRNKDDTLIADTFELSAGKSISSLTLLEAPEFGNVDCTVTITAFRDGKQIGTLNTKLTLHTAYLWPKEVQ